MATELPVTSAPAAVPLAEPGTAVLIASLSIAGLISGLLLVGIYQATLPLIRANQAAALQAAIFRVLPGTVSTAALRREGNELVAAPGQAKAGEERVYAGFSADGQPVGFAVPAEGPGFQDTIVLLYGFDASRRVMVGMEVLESRETPGLGDKILIDPHFLENFKALAVEPTIVPVKKGAKTKPNEVDTITGATISSKAVIAILVKSTSAWLPLVTAADAATTAQAARGAAAPAAKPAAGGGQ